MPISIYVLTHKPFVPPSDKIYIPLSVHEKRGDNIASKNDTFSELTGLYWIWKNDTSSDIIGTAHYRRYLLSRDKKLLTEAMIRDILSEYDCITTKELKLNNSFYYGFSTNHKPYYLKELKNVLFRLYPDYAVLYEQLIRENHTYFGNMMIAPVYLYSEYCSWLFSILFEMEKELIIDEPDSYHKRIFGFISEFLWYLYVRKNSINAYETIVGMTSEKAETSEIKKHLAQFFSKGDYISAKNYFLSERIKRPDILMEASDISGELHLCMEVISICEFEAAAGKKVLLDRITDFNALMDYCRKLNNYVLSSIRNSSDLMEKITEEEIFSKEALYVAERMFSNNF
ncbi:MAG: DUF4422 domain-containing protein [Lachnospiraceae bacterium]|nr:DUF4422 domain-containing protein [Lachnospiraceae bacterium]